MNKDLYKKMFSILQDLSHAMTGPGSISLTASFMLDLAVDYTGAQTGSLMLLNEHNELYILAARGIDDRYIREYRGKPGTGIAGSVAQDRQLMLVQDINKDPRFQGVTQDHYKTRSFISCPILNKDKLLGVINVNDKNGGPFTKQEADLIQVIANYAAMAFENTLLLARLKEQATDLKEMNRKLTEADIQKTRFLTLLSHELRTPLNSIRGSVYYLQQAKNVEKGDQREFYGIIAAETDQLRTIVENLLEFLRIEDASRVFHKTVLNVAGIFRELQDSPSLKPILNAKGLNLDIAYSDGAADIVGDRVRVNQLFINLLDGLCQYLEQGDTIRMSARDGECVTIEIALPRTLPRNDLPHIHDTPDVRQDANSDARMQFHLARNFVEINRWKLHAENVGSGCRIFLAIPKNAKEKMEACVTKSMDSFVDFISQLLDLDICSIMLGDELTGELTVKSARGLNDDLIKRTRIMPGDKIAGWVALEGKPLFIEDIERDPRFTRKNTPQYHTSSLMSLPLKIDDRVVGVLNLNNKRNSEPFTRQDYETAVSVSEKLSYFIKRIYANQYTADEFNQFIASFNRFSNNGKETGKPRRPGTRNAVNVRRASLKNKAAS